MYLLERLYGRPAAEGIGKGLVIEWDPSAVNHRRAPGALLPGAGVR